MLQADRQKLLQWYCIREARETWRKAHNSGKNPCCFCSGESPTTQFGSHSLCSRCAGVLLREGHTVVQTLDKNRRWLCVSR